MVRLARADLFDPAALSVVHCINRYLRRCFLCDYDPLAGTDYQHRKAWLEERLKLLAGQFGIDMLGLGIVAGPFMDTSIFASVPNQLTDNEQKWRPTRTCARAQNCEVGPVVGIRLHCGMTRIP